MGDSYPDQTGYDSHYGAVAFDDLDARTDREFVTNFQDRYALPFHDGGWVHDGECLQNVLQRITAICTQLGKKPEDLTLLDAGSGLGHTSVYFAAIGFNVISIEISTEGVEQGRKLAEKMGVTCDFRQCSLEDTGLDSDSVDLFFGRNTLHHFIKYPAVAAEFRRIGRDGATGLFLDPFGENRVKNLFHDKQRMARLGDELLTKQRIETFFNQEAVELQPMCWFSLTNKLFIRLFGWSQDKLLRKLATLAHRLDSFVPYQSRVALWFAGRVVTVVRY